MAAVDNQQNWLPYDGSIDKDCSQGFCNIYCPQWCYVLFSPPPPLSLGGADYESGTTFSPLVIAVIAILASALLLVSYYTFVSKNCASLSFSCPPTRLEEEIAGGGGTAAASVRHEEWQASPSNGLEEGVINKIAVLRFKRGESIVDGTECSVCLGEFKEAESLRLLPKCNHAFHLQCIDTWLKSHANCPLCRANIVVEPDEHEEQRVINIEDGESGEEEEEEEDHGTDVVEIGEVDAQYVRRCMSMGSMEAENCGLVGESGTWRRSEREQSTGNGRNRGLNCVVRTVHMKRSFSSGRFFFGGQRSGRAFLLPV